MSTPCWYSGSMQPIDFGEEGQPKGFMVLDVDPAKGLGARVGSGTPKLIDVPARRFVTITSRPKDLVPMPRSAARSKRSGITDTIVRVQVHLSADQLRQLRIPEARRLLDAAHYVAGISTHLPEGESGLAPCRRATGRDGPAANSRPLLSQQAVRG